MKVAFISCAKVKKAYSAPAQDLYQSALFRKALVYTRYHYSHVYILSAHYGLLPLDKVIAPYEKTLNTMSKTERREWADMVLRQMRQEGIDGAEHWFYTSARYSEFFPGNKPLAGLSLCRQLHWYTKRLKMINQHTLFSL